MGVLSIRSLRQPSHKIKVLRSVQAQGIAIEQVRNQGIVSVRSILISHQLAVLPDANDVGEEEDRGIFVHFLALGLRDISFDAADFDGGSCGLASVECQWM